MEELAVRNLVKENGHISYGRASSDKLVKENGHISAWKS